MEEDKTAGSITASPEERARLAAASHAFNASQPAFCKVFPELAEQQKARAAAAAAAGARS